MIDAHTSNSSDGIAIIGMAGRFPRAKNVAEFWRNIRDGIDCISRFAIEELEVAGASRFANDPSYVRARSVIDDADLFDAAFFGILPKEAELIDPQQRVFLECCWEALEDAGYDPQAYPGAVAVYAGSSPNTYFLRNLCTKNKFVEEYTEAYQIGNYSILLGTNPDFLASRVSYKLNLRGPSFTIQCGCSTSLVAVCQACQSLLTYQSDMALAGGVSITFPQKRGYSYQEGGMGSADGYCRAFDAKAQGTVFGSGAAVVLLKRLEEAINDGDHVYAVIKGFALNNDGAAKVGYTAPSIDGQAKVIAMAHAVSGVSPDSITYVEAHGTATPLGDPIEFAALTRAFRAQTQANGFCALGTAKMNVGHLDIAAGVSGLINVANMLTHKQLAPAIHFETPSPNVDLADSPFYVNTRLAPWKNDPAPRRAGVSAFGVGGTNAHVVLEEAPTGPLPETSRSAHLLVLSARTEQALNRATENLADHLQARPDADLSSVAYTLQAGRRAFEHRRTVVCSDVGDAIQALKSGDQKRTPTRVHEGAVPLVVFMFPGQGSQYVNMSRDLYHRDAHFRSDIDACSEILKRHLGFDLRSVLYPSAIAPEASTANLQNTEIAQPALFVIEFALARLWMGWGVKPEAMIGHSIGELVAACLAGVLKLEDMLAVVATRARMMQQLPAGGMLSVRLPAAEVKPLLNGSVSLAAINSPKLCVASGPALDIDALERELGKRGVASRRLRTSHAFHSSMMDPIVEAFTEYVRQFSFKAPTTPFISGVSGTWITESEATDPAYWARHFREPVRFSDGLNELLGMPERLFLEVGPGHTLQTLVSQHRDGSTRPTVFSSLADSADGRSDSTSILQAAGMLWLNGVTPDWVKMHSGRGRRCSLPTYPFERKRYWLDPLQDSRLAAAPNDIREQDSGVSIMNALKPIEMQAPSIPVAPPSSRSARIRSSLVEIFENLSGLQVASFEPSTTFLEMGFDSLFLTQVTQELQSKFGLKVGFRQLLDEQSTIDALAAHIDSRLPADAVPEEAPAVKPTIEAATNLQSEARQVAVAGAAATPNASVIPIPAGIPAMEAIVREQLQLMAKQLDLLRTGAASMDSTVVIPSAVVQLPPAAPATQPKPSAAVSTPAPTGEFKPFGPYKPVQKGTLGGLTEEQSRYLEGLIKRYTRRTARSKEHTQAHRRKLADPRVAAGFRSQWKEMVYPIVTVRSKGSRLWDLDGNEYIDILNGFGPIMFGHAPDFVTQAVGKQLHEGFEIGPQTPLAGKVADLVCELTGMERATFCNTGSEAVMAAIRLARTVTARTRIVLFAGAYHGTFDEVLVKGIRKQGLPHSLPIAPGIPNEKVANVTVLDFATQESLEYIRAHASELAAVLVEPVQSRHPALQPAEFLREIREITAKSGAALIFDEVVTGFRVHPGGAQAVFGIKADLATYGKVVGGGLPIGILAGVPKFMDALDGGMWQYGDDSYPEVGVTFFAGTFVRHPLALAAVHAVLNHLKEKGPQLQQELNDKTSRFAKTLNTYFEERGVPTRIEHFGSIFYFGFPPDLRFGSLLYYHLRERGVHIQEGFPCFLTTVHTDADIDHVIRAFKESIVEMQEGGVLPEPTRSGQPTSSVASTLARPSDAETPKEAPLTEAQMEIWLSARLSDEANCAYNESFTVHLRGSSNESALREAIQQLIDRHDALRCTFDPKSDHLRIPEHISIDMPMLDFSSFPGAERSTRLEQLIEDDAATPFDLVNGPLIRVAFIKLEQDLHALLVTTHHIVCDGWSTNVLLGELSQIYGSKVARLECKLPAAPQFLPYARSHADWLRSADRAAVESWWAEKFATPVSALDLPTDRPRAAVKSFQGATARATIDAAQYQKVKRFGAQHGCTLFATLLAGFKILLHRLTAHQDIVVGIPAAGQSLLEDNALVGHCVNFLPVRSSFDGDPVVGKFFSQVKNTLLDSYEHQNYTYGSLVRKLALPRDPSRLPLVEVQFNLERVGTGFELPGLDVEVDGNPKRFVNFDLFLNIVESEKGLVLDCDYNSDLFDRETIERWLGHYKTLLASMQADARTTVSKLAILDDDERHRLLVEWNNTRMEFPKEKCIHSLFEDQVARTPQAVAVEFDGQQLTYVELDGRANQLARYLRGLGVGPELTVAICLDRSLDMLVGVLGVLKAGGAYVPLDPNYPDERIEAVLQDARPCLLLTQKTVAARFDAVPTPIVALEDIGAAIAGQSKERPDSGVTTENLAYLIYTSGSTGKPKGVQITHRSVVNFLCSMKREPGISPEDRLVAVTTLSFDIAGLELFLPLITGARVIIASREVASDGDKLLALMDASGVTVMQATPATWRLLLEAGWEGSRGLKILCGGEALPRELADQLLPRAAAVWNMYGPTETTIWSATSLVDSGTGPVTIGPPIANTQFCVLDGVGQPVPVGIPGELYIGGEGVARGYCGQQALTADKFVPNPFTHDPRARLYRTGDQVRYRNDGKLEFLGRLDTQVKVRGFRIETSEVESVISQYASVRECVVIAREDTPGDKRLVAYIVAGPAALDLSDLKNFVATKLPDYMVPSIIVPMSALPRTPNGKVHRRELPPPVARARPSESRMSPNNPREQTLAEICAKVLRLDRIGIDESLFDLGADSLHVFQIVARANDAGLHLTPKHILADRTVSAICATLEQSANGKSNVPVTRLAPVSRDKYRIKRSWLS
jgi:amino acid adenylation domain-containing protein